MKRIFFEGSSSDEFIAQLCLKFGELISEFKKENKPDSNGLLTRQEAADMLKITLPTLNNWTKAGVLTASYLGRRVYYNKQDIINSLNR
jgi:excisionase family DNA binding protein